MIGLVRWIVERLERIAPRGIWMIPICLVGFNIWRGQPFPIVGVYNGAGVVAVILCLAAFRMAPREVISLALLAFLGAVVAAGGANDPQMTRVFLGGLFLIAAWTAAEHAETPFDKALALGLWSEFIVWALGNASRGTFGPDVALSAIGQAYGPWAQPAQWSLILAAYLAAWYNNNRKANTA
jgi:hypothetical protein